MLNRFLLPGLVVVLLLIGACQRRKAETTASAAGNATSNAAASTKAAAPAGKQLPGNTTVATGPRALRFGSGGGFVGSVTTYTLYPDGRLTRQMGMPGNQNAEATPLRAAPADATKRAFAAFDALPADSLREEPGNMYYFLRGATAAGRPLAAVWSGGGAPHAVRVLYRDLVALTAQQ